MRPERVGRLLGSFKSHVCVVLARLLVVSEARLVGAVAHQRALPLMAEPLAFVFPPKLVAFAQDRAALVVPFFGIDILLVVRLFGIRTRNDCIEADLNGLRCTNLLLQCAEEFLYTVTAH